MNVEKIGKFKITFKNQYVFFVALFALNPVWGMVTVDGSDRVFKAQVDKELAKLRNGTRGLVCQELMNRLDQAEANTIIKPLTLDQETWHPNDRKGKRSHVVPQDVHVRGAARSKPTNAVFYLHSSRIDPKLSTFKLGTFVHKLAEASDLNNGTFSGTYQIRERRWAFFRNAWRDALIYPLMERQGEILTVDFQNAKLLGLITEENKSKFPILNVNEFIPYVPLNKTDVSDLRKIELNLGEVLSGDNFYSVQPSTESFITFLIVNDLTARIRFGWSSKNIFEIYEYQCPREKGSLRFDNNSKGIDFSELIPQSQLVRRGRDRKDKSKFYSLWTIDKKETGDSFEFEIQ